MVMQPHGSLLNKEFLPLQAQDFSKIMAVLFRQVARCLNSSHFQVPTPLASPERLTCTRMHGHMQLPNASLDHAPKFDWIKLWGLPSIAMQHYRHCNTNMSINVASVTAMRVHDKQSQNSMGFACTKPWQQVH